MTVQLNESRTKKNLMRAFAGESQARNRYTIAAEEARNQGMYTVADIFLFTADQERAHAERFYSFLKKFSGETIFIDGGYPVDLEESLEGLLRAAEHNEREEADRVYQEFGDIAREEGFLEVASAFYQIAEIERTHQLRFGKIADMLRDGTYYDSMTEGKWMCTNCGYIHEGKMAPQICPVCRYEKGYFIPLGFACYTGCLTVG